MSEADKPFDGMTVIIGVIGIERQKQWGYWPDDIKGREAAVKWACNPVTGWPYSTRKLYRVTLDKTTPLAVRPAVVASLEVADGVLRGDSVRPQGWRCPCP